MSQESTRPSNATPTVTSSATPPAAMAPSSTVSACLPRGFDQATVSPSSPTQASATPCSLSIPRKRAALAPCLPRSPNLNRPAQAVLTRHWGWTRPRSPSRWPVSQSWRPWRSFLKPPKVSTAMARSTTSSAPCWNTPCVSPAPNAALSFWVTPPTPSASSAGRIKMETQPQPRCRSPQSMANGQTGRRSPTPSFARLQSPISTSSSQTSAPMQPVATRASSCTPSAPWSRSLCAARTPTVFSACFILTAAPSPTTSPAPASRSSRRSPIRLRRCSKICA